MAAADLPRAQEQRIHSKTAQHVLKYKKLCKFSYIKSASLPIKNRSYTNLQILFPTQKNKKICMQCKYRQYTLFLSHRFYYFNFMTNSFFFEPR